VSPSTLGPPSPSSSPSSSPRLPNINLSDFAQAFPSIDELDELHGLQLQSVPTGAGIDAAKASLDFSNEGSSLPVPVRSFPVLSVDPGPRPSSTPITPTISTLVSRPASPVHLSIKPSNLSLPSKSPARPKSPLPVSNIVYPKVLYEYMNQIGYKVLLLDVRTRAEFEKAHIRGDAVVCLEPSVLLREK
jgi:ubiquitin carboxyl-terminal hydrolase 8